jgi:hypothetical protein
MIILTRKVPDETRFKNEYPLCRTVSEMLMLVRFWREKDGCPSDLADCHEQDRIRRLSENSK